ncbi:LamG-like jellyroll fold domain-containing protein [Kutzneria sp. NPDC052558]|uniref:LamG-like jellyroll fold domain-containing protein n=1 Tax=Kutzneria sp. NPDC052558 TaxID=3364121 RepID=UPI0037CBB39D
MRARLALLSATMVVAALATPVTAAAATVLGTVPVQAGQQLSVSIYDEAGNVVRQLSALSQRTGQYTVSWDGKDDNGDDTLPGNYSWRAAVSTVTGAYDRPVGDPGVLVGNKPMMATETPSQVSAVAYDPAGDLFTDSQSEEWDALRKYPPGTIDNGNREWLTPGGTNHRGYAVAADNDHVYVAARLDGATPNQLVIYRTNVHALDANTAAGTDAPFSASVPHIIVKSQWTFGQPVISGMAVDQKYLLVSDDATTSLLAYDKNTGLPASVLNGQSSLRLDGAPHAITTDGNGVYWIVVGNTVQQYTMDNAGHFTAGATITDGLIEPYGVTWDRSNGRSLLYVSDAGTGKIRAFDVSATPRDTKATQFDHLGLMDGPGPVDDSHFGWQLDGLSAMTKDASIAVSPDGTTLAVTDIWNERTLFFDTTTGQARDERFAGVFNPAPDVDNGTLSSSGFEFTTDNDGSWRLAANWNPGGPVNTYMSLIRTVGDKRYLYVFDNGIVVYRLGDDGGRGVTKVAQLTMLANGVPSSQIGHEGRHLSLVTDRDGIKPGDTVTYTNFDGFLFGNPSVWVDADGALWFAEAGHRVEDQAGNAKLTVGIGTLPMEPTGTALYNLARFTLPANGLHEFDPPTSFGSPKGQQIRHTAGSKYIYSEVDNGSFNQNGNYAGNAIAVTDLTANDPEDAKKKTFVIPGHSPLDGKFLQARDTIGAMALDSQGGYLYTTGYTYKGQEITMRTWDGLPVGHAAITSPRQGTGEIDNGLSMTAHTTSDGRHFVYTEDDGDETNQRFVFSNGTVQRYGSDPDTGSTAGDFHWDGVSTTLDLKAWWKLDAQRSNFGYVADSTGNNHWGSQAAQSKVPAEIPDGPRNGAMTFNGEQYVQFTKNTNGVDADNVFTGSTPTSVSLWFRTAAAGVLLSTQNDGMAVTDPNRSGHPPTAAVPLLYVDKSRYVHGGGTSPSCPGAVSTVQVTDNAWHNVVLTRTHKDTDNDTALYVDGASPTHTDCTPANQSVTVLGDGYTGASTAPWPATDGGYLPLNGALDDVRVYTSLLTADDARTLATPKPLSPVFADWRFDEPAGSTTFLDSAAEHDLTTAHSTQAAGGGGLHFTGDEKEEGGTLPVIARKSLTVDAPETVTVRVRVPVGGAGGPVLGEQSGAFPVSRQYPYIGGATSAVSAISVVGGKVNSYLMNLPLNSDCAIADGQWHTIAITSSVDAVGTTFHNQLYVSGCSTVASASGVQGLNVGYHTDMQFGAARVDVSKGDGPSTWSYFAGDIGEAQIYQRVLSQSELKALGVVPAT